MYIDLILVIVQNNVSYYKHIYGQIFKWLTLYQKSSNGRGSPLTLKY